EIELGLHGILGSVSQVGPRAHFPLAGLTPQVFARNRIALVGEAAHVFPPIGAQGLNLGFRDAAALAEQVGHALANDGDPGAAAVMSAYNRNRRSDVLTRTAAVDLLNRSLLSGLLPLQMARGAGLHLLKSIAPLRQFIMRQGVAPSRNLPPLMRNPSPAMPASGT
ncbi:MAG: FAD-dependent monooxygenase, partial [Hyphomicrobiales bacterium]|nr:FAD-dependent monooxygenase [Hyphomicrobiales bacterium]